MFEEANLRKRGKLASDFTPFGSAVGMMDGNSYNHSWKFPFLPCLISAAVGFILLMGISTLSDHRLPAPILLKDASSHPGAFIGERAYKHLERLTSIGPRVAGSYENEIRTVDLLMREIGFIKQFANAAHKITMDIQKPSGVMTPMTDGIDHNTIYHALANVVVKIEDKNSSHVNAESLLVNAHFDSVFGSPGASDNGVSVAVALEVLEVLTRRTEPTRHPVIFLFNGAEEKGMLGAHGFITQHPWAKQVGAFVNLDACGAGGREIVFQAGPGNSWLIKAYAAAAPYPFANIVAQEIFEAKLVPSDTDFKIFRDFGQIPGLDLAYFKNGYVYHTKYDDIQHVSLSSVQRAGDNLLALVSNLANSDWPSMRDSGEIVIFFDYLGLFMITFSNVSWHLLNITLITLAFYQSIAWVTLQDADSPSGRIGTVCKQVVFSCLTGVFQMLGAFFAAWLIVGVMTLAGFTMSWYSRPHVLIGLYGMPALAVALFVFLQVSAAQERALKSSFLMERVQFEGAKLNLTLIVLLTYMYGIRANVLLLLWLSSAIFGRWFLDKVYQRKTIDGGWLLLHFFSFAVPILQTLYLSDSVIALLVPISGRNGIHSNPDLLVAMVTVAFGLLIAAFLFPLVSLVRHARRILFLLMAGHLLVVLAVIFTPLGFPYSTGIVEAKPQRVQILHVERTFYESNGLVRRRESGYWLFGWDHHIKPELLAPLEPREGVKLVDESHCHTLPYCGLPYYFPYLKRIRSSYWAPAPQPLIYHPTRIELIDLKLTGVDKRSLTFTLTGPDHMTLMIWPISGVKLVGWSASKELPHADSFYTERPLYFVTYFYGVQPNTPYELTVTLEVPPSLSGKQVLEIAVTSHILHGHESMANEFANTLKKFPSWMYAHGWTATYSHWSF